MDGTGIAVPKIVFTDSARKPVYLKQHQYTQVQDHIDCHDCFFPRRIFPDQKSRKVIDKCGSDHQNHIDRLSISIKRQARKKKHSVFCPDPGKQQMKQEYHRKKDT